MKFFLSLILIAISFSTFAGTRKEARQLQKAQKGMLTCAFRYIEQKRNGIQSATHAAQLIEKILEVQDADQLAELRKDCKKTRKKTSKVRSMQWPELAQVWRTDRLNYDSRIVQIVDAWVNPTSHCSYISVGASIPRRQRNKIGGGAALAHCQNELGLKFIALIPFVSSRISGNGVFIHADVGHQVLHHHSPGYFHDSLLIGVGPAAQFSSGQSGLGLGVGFGVQLVEHQATNIVKLIPTGFDFTEILEVLFPN